MINPLYPNSTLDRLALRLRGVAAKRAGAALVLWGEAGIGKTYTVQHLFRTSSYRTFNVHAALPLAQWPEVLPGSPKLPLWAARLSERLVRSELLETDDLAHALGARLVALAPCVLHLEDAHEVLPERLELLLALARTVRRGRGVGLLVTSRVELAEPFEPFRLEPLTPTTAEDLVQREIGASLPQDALEWLYGRAAGNPLFTLEYLRLLSRQGFLWNDGRRWHWRRPAGGLMPVTVEALIEQQLNDAGQVPDSETALQSKALLPVDAPDTLWADVADLSISALEATKLELDRRGLVRDGSFVHPLYREVALNMVTSERKRDFSRGALNALREQPEQAVAFVTDAGLEPEAALALFKAAAERTKGRNEVEAAGFLATAVLYAGDDEKGRLALRAARTLSHSDVGRAERLLEVAAGDEALRAQALFLLAELLASQGRRAEAERVLERLPTAQRTGLAWASHMVQIHSVANNDAGVLELLRTHPGVLAGNAVTLSRIVRAMAHDGRLREGERLVHERLADPNLEPNDRIPLLKALSVIAYTRADFAEMERLEADIYSLARPLGDLRLMDAALYNRALALGGLGRYAEQKASLKAALEVCLELGDLSAYAIAQVAYADLLTDAADYQEAETLFREAHAVLQGVGHSAFLVGCEASLAKLYESWRPPHGKQLALKHASASLREARQRNTASLLVEGLCAAARAEAWGGSAARAESLALEALERTRHLDMPAARLNALDAHARSLLAIGKTEKASAVFAEAQVLAQSLGEAAQRLVALELAYLDHDLESAKTHLAWFKARGLVNGVNLAERYFPELAAKPPSSATPSPLRLEVLGPLCCLQEGKEMSVRGQQRKALLGLLLEASLAGCAQARTSDLCEALYPDEDEAGAQRALKQLVFQVRAQLGASVIVTTPDGYTLGAVASDAADFLATGDTTLWRGRYLESMETHDETVRGTLYEALKERTAELIEEDPAEAARAGHLLIEAEPYDVKALKLTLTALQKTQRRTEMATTYREGCVRLLEVGEVLPAEVTTFLAFSTL